MQPFIDESSLTSFVVHWLRYIPLVILCVLPAYFKVVKKKVKGYKKKIKKWCMVCIMVLVTFSILWVGMNLSMIFWKI